MKKSFFRKIPTWISDKSGTNIILPPFYIKLELLKQIVMVLDKNGDYISSLTSLGTEKLNAAIFDEP